jgi:hypothetical protein
MSRSDRTEQEEDVAPSELALRLGLARGRPQRKDGVLKSQRLGIRQWPAEDVNRQRQGRLNPGRRHERSIGGVVGKRQRADWDWADRRCRADAPPRSHESCRSTRHLSSSALGSKAANSAVLRPVVNNGVRGVDPSPQPPFVPPRVMLASTRPRAARMRPVCG